VEIAFIFLIVIILLAIVDLTVGVANDAVNFLNSAIGSKVAAFKTALFVAALGVLVGVTLSSGMMEIARKGIFNPAAFSLYDVMIICLVTMVTDILLLDFFNTYGIPTSTTVSMISSMTGGALGLSIVYLVSSADSGKDLAHFMNLAKLTTIYTAILVSIVVAFVVGFASQFLSRILFTFDFSKNFKRYGPLWGSFAITFILFFIIVKGLEGASFADKSMIEFINENKSLILVCNFIFWAVVFYFFVSFFKANILKFIVLTGTFALALAFASNDLVNFVGPALTSIFAFELANGHIDPLNMTMEGLAAPIKASTYILLLSGFVMVVTLFLSKKARTVTTTEVSLGRQIEGYEAFESLPVARAVVRMAVNIASFVSKLVPAKLRNWVNSRFDASKVILYQDANGERASFDLIRATVNLAISAGLISLGTSFKLPLSTTYVTFIVAMSTAFADRSWGVDNAVYRVSGILTVIGGWLLTALICLITSGVIAVILYFTGIFGVLFFLGLIVFSFARTAIIHRKRDKERKEAEEKLRLQINNLETSFSIFIKDVSDFLQQVKSISNLCLQGIAKYKLKDLKKARKQAIELQHKTEEIYTDFARSIKAFDDNAFDSAHIYASSMSDLSIISNQIYDICDRCYSYVSNSQRALTNNQIDDLKTVTKLFNNVYEKIIKLFEGNPFYDSDVHIHQEEFSKEIKRINKTYMKAMKRPGANTKRAILYIFLVENLFSTTKKLITLVEAMNSLRGSLKEKAMKVE
jgi:phosphate/sulfate permease